MPSLNMDASGNLLEPLANIALGGGLTPTALSGSVNNYNPTGLATASVLRLGTGAGSYNITGIAAQAGGKLLLVQNIDATGTITLKHLSGSSSAGNKINGANAADVAIRPLGSCLLWYDGVAAVWQTVAI